MTLQKNENSHFLSGTQSPDSHGDFINHFFLWTGGGVGRGGQEPAESPQRVKEAPDWTLKPRVTQETVFWRKRAFKTS